MVNRHSLTPGLGLSALALAALLQAGCSHTIRIVRRPPDRGTRLLMLAAEEAAQVASHTERLTRLLNVAHRQIKRGQGAYAAAALRQARSTLQESPSLGAHARMSAWVSLSELLRGVGNLGAAREAAAEAQKFLKGLLPVAKRTEYVRGLALELRYLKGEKPAAALLREAAGWAATIRDPARRRRAYTAIAWDLFVCEDFDGGKQVLRRDADPAWRSDTLTRLASLGTYRARPAWRRGGRARARRFDFQAASELSGTAPASVRWGKSLNFESTYLRR